MEQLTTDWRKSSYSGNGGANCVEAGSAPGQILVRDTKNDGRGPVLAFSKDEWQRFAASLKRVAEA
jgi:hypothetical protein